DVHAMIAAAADGRELTYTLRQGADVFRLALPVRPFSAGDFIAVFAPMLGVGLWTLLVGAAVLILRPDLAAVRALFVTCALLALVLLTGPDQYGPYRFTSVIFLALAVLPAALLHLTATFAWHPVRWVRRVVVGLYAGCAVLGAVLLACRADPAVFLPLLYLVYCVLANAILLYLGSLVAALSSRRGSRRQLGLGLAAIAASSAPAVAILVTYPLRSEAVSATWLIAPLALWPLLTGIALLRVAPDRTPVERR
ncbi:MAG TPA: hypothetical protein VGC36_17760, partial [Rhizomicrobium sp.]